MKISRDSIVPQVELGPRLGGFKQLFQRTGIVVRPITMFSAMAAAWSTTAEIQALFGSFAVFALTAVAGMGAWMAFDFVVLYPSEQTFNQEQSQRPERSPTRRDTMYIRERVDELAERLDDVE